MTERKRALITGITGQDGSYLSELLLEKGYEVHGIIRRTSTFNTDRIDHIYEDPHREGVRLFLHYGDLTDGTTLRRLLEAVQPVEIYNLGAQSHVRVSFDSPEYTVDTVAMGTLRLLEAIRDYQHRTGIQVRYYQAGSSEMFGKVQEIPQKETTPFYPRSPYSCAKVYAHWQTVNYRESYDLFACNGILFNHECVTAETPVIIRQDGIVDIVPIADIVPHQRDGDKKGIQRYTTDVSPSHSLQVWDANGWTEVTCMTATWNGSPQKTQKQVHRMAAAGAVYHTTSDHVVFTQQGETTWEKPTAQVNPGESLALIDLPPVTIQMDLTETEAWLLGVLAAAGTVTRDGTITITDEQQLWNRDRLAASWRKLTGGELVPQESDNTWQLTGNTAYGRYLYASLYSQTGDVRVPKRVLNAGDAERLAFLEGFYAWENQDGDAPSLPSYQTSSAVLAAGLYWFVRTTLHQQPSIDTVVDGNTLYYQLHFSENGSNQALVTTASPVNYDGWLFDLATTSGTFHAGVGRGWIHNSPRRGETFVTRKITRAVARIFAGQQKNLYMGNLDAKRDWGYAKDYVKAMWLMLQQDEPDDYVIATGETHSVREFLELAFSHVNLNWQDYVAFDPRYLRPAEVDLLIGDCSKAQEKLGWEKSVSFQELVALMVEADLASLGLTSPHGPAKENVVDRALIRQELSTYFE